MLYLNLLGDLYGISPLDLTLTSVVFEFRALVSPVFSAQNLTLTSVVFELASYSLSPCHTFNLTLTSVVFE